LEVSPESSPGVGIVEVYEHPLFLGNDTVIPPTPVAQCPATTTTNCPALNQLPIMSGLKSSIGIGIDGDRNAIKSFSCLDGTISTIDGGTATFNVNAITSYSDILRESKKSAGGNISVGFFKAGGGVTEGEYFRQTSYDQSFAMKYVVSLGTQKFSPNPINPFYSSVEQYKTNPCLLRQYCGDRFVEQTELGAQLYVTMNFHFTSEVYKKEFMANANAGISTTLTGKTCTPCGVATSWSVPISADINASISKLSQTVKQNGTMEVTAIQEGGSVENLASVIGSRFATCSLTNITACTALMDKAINYAATKFADSVRSTQPKVLSYSSNLMATIPGVPVMPSDVTPAITEARELIATEYQKRITDKERMELLLATYLLNSSHYQQLTSLVQALDNDIVALRGAGEVCFSDLSSCLSKKCDVFGKLTAYNEDVFKLGLDEGLAAYYPFNGNADDVTSNKNNGIVYGAKLTADRNGKLNAAYEFNGTSDYIWLASPSSLKVSPFAVATWFKSSGGYSTTQIIYRWRLYGMSLLVSFNNSRKCTAGYGNTADEGFTVFSTTNCDDGKWHHLVSSYNGSTLKLYVDGQLVANQIANGQVYYGAGGAAIGRDGDWSDSFFKGVLDDLRIYGRSLSAEEVQALYQMPS